MKSKKTCHISAVNTPESNFDTFTSRVYGIAVHISDKITSQTVKNYLEMEQIEHPDQSEEEIVKTLVTELYNSEITLINDTLTFFRDLPIFQKNIQQLFKGTEAFAIILNILGVLKNFCDTCKDIKSIYCKYTHYKNFSRNDVEKHFGPIALKLYDSDQQPTDKDHRYILDKFYEYFDNIQKQNPKQQLFDLLAQLEIFEEHFLIAKNPKSNTKWTPEIICEAKRLHANQTPSKVIAEILTRNHGKEFTDGAVRTKICKDK